MVVPLFRFLPAEGRREFEMRMPLSPNDFPPEAEKCGHENCQQPGVT
jgi:hypothetical protein